MLEKVKEFTHRKRKSDKESMLTSIAIQAIRNGYSVSAGRSEVDLLLEFRGRKDVNIIIERNDLIGVARVMWLLDVVDSLEDDAVLIIAAQNFNPIEAGTLKSSPKVILLEGLTEQEVMDRIIKLEN